VTARPPPLLLRARQSASVAIRARGSPSFAGRAGHLGGVRAQHEADFAVGGAGCTCPMRWPESYPPPTGSGAGSGYFLRVNFPLTLGPGSSVATSRRWMRLWRGLESDLQFEEVA